MSEPRYTTMGAVALVLIHHPPVNALGHAVRTHIMGALDEAEADPDVQAIVLMGNGPIFSAGADMRELPTEMQEPSLPQVCNRIEDCTKPVVAAMHGNALGGGLEVAMAAHYRLASSNARFGLPEVKLGLLPGAGGTQRAPRLLGVARALNLMLEGTSISAQSAFESGLVDRLAEGDDLLSAAITYCHELLGAGASVRHTRERPIRGGEAAGLQVASEVRRGIASRLPTLLAPARILDAVEAALTQPFAAGQAFERAAFTECLNSSQHQGLRHAFLAERQAMKASGSGQAPTSTLEEIGVVGGGTMGIGIALALLDAGFNVTLIERDDGSLARAASSVGSALDRQVAKGRITLAARSESMARLTCATDHAALSNADLVIEAVFEDIAVKSALFAALDRVCKPGAILATNTSYLDITVIAAQTRRPNHVIGLHFFSPANIMKLLEIVVPEQTSAATVATAFALARKLGKTPVRAGVCDGFIGNRILATYREAADLMLEDGASPYQIDSALRDFGFAMGPYEVSDLAGGDIGWATRKRKAPTRDPRMRYVQVADRLCERGWFGQKSGRGFYRYAPGTRTAVPDPEVLAIIDAERARAGVAPRGFSNEEIVRRYMAAMINEGAKVVEEGIALRPLDVDVTLLAGYGFPRFRGGPMKYADMVGLPDVLADIKEFAREDPRFWQPAALLSHLVESGLPFDSLNRSCA